jgi:uncharacterized protein with GYD domain
MKKFLMRGSYTVEGVQGLMKVGGSSRRSHFEEITKSLGGTVESFYYAFGSNDVFAIVDLPGDAEAAALSLGIAAGGAFSPEIVVLFDPELVDEAVKKDIRYRPPGD